MFDRLKKHWRMTRAGLLTFVEAQGFAAKLLINVIREYKSSTSPPAFVEMMVGDPEYITYWAKKYYAHLESALDCTTGLDQAKGLRRLTVDYLDVVAEGIWTVHESDNPWKLRSEPDRTVIGRQIRPALSPQDFFEYEVAVSALADLSQRITKTMCEEFFGDRAGNYADAYEATTQMLWRLRCEGILWEDRRGEFPAHAHLEFLEAVVPVKRQQVCEGRSYLVDDSLRAVVLRNRASPGAPPGP